MSNSIYFVVTTTGILMYNKVDLIVNSINCFNSVPLMDTSIPKPPWKDTDSN